MNQYPIRVVSQLTGIPATTLRAWERRYGLLSPSRTAKGHRLYSQADIDLVKQVVQLLKSDHTIGEAIKVIRNPAFNKTNTEVLEGHWAVIQKRLLTAIGQFDDKKLDATYNESLSLYPIDLVTEKAIIPVLQGLDERSKQRENAIAEKRFFSVFLRNKMGARLNHEAFRSNGAKILVACWPKEYDELELLLFCMSALGHGYQVLYLGADLPLSQVAFVAKKAAVSGVLLSSSKPDLWRDSDEQTLQNLLTETLVPVMLGGALANAQQARLTSIGAYTLDIDQAQALRQMRDIVPPFSAKD